MPGISAISYMRSIERARTYNVKDPTGKQTRIALGKYNQFLVPSAAFTMV